MHQSGIKRWSRRFGTDWNDQVVGLFDGEWGVLVVLKTETSSAESKLFHTVLYRFDAEGEKIWERSLQGLLPGPALAVREIENGHLLLAGYGSDTQKLEEGSSSGAKDENAFAARLDQDGDLVWLEIFGGKGSERALAISETPAGTSMSQVTQRVPLMDQSTRAKKTCSWCALILRENGFEPDVYNCLLYTSPSPRDSRRSRMPSSA